MSDILNGLERGFIDAVAPAYLARAKAPCPERVGSWRYRGFMPLQHEPVPERLSGLFCLRSMAGGCKGLYHRLWQCDFPPPASSTGPGFSCGAKKQKATWRWPFA